MRKKLLRLHLICTGLSLLGFNNISEAVLTPAEEVSVQTICTRVRSHQQPPIAGNDHTGNVASSGHFSLLKTYITDHTIMNYNDPPPQGRHTIGCPGCSYEWQLLYQVGQLAGMNPADQTTKLQEVMTQAATYLDLFR